MNSYGLMEKNPTLSISPSPPPSASLSLPPQAADERDTRLDPGAAPALLPDGGSEVSPEQGETSRG